MKQTFAKIHVENFKRFFYFFYHKPYINRDTAEDLVSETFLRGYKYTLENSISEEEVLKLLFGIAKNVYKEWVKKNIAMAEVEFNEEISSFIDEYEALDDPNISSTEIPNKHEKMIEQCKDVIDTFSDKLKYVMRYRFIEGLSRAETAQILHISEDAVHTYQKRGIKYLKEKVVPQE
ncbi:RNA polymerase sigma factor [bacterium]|nr:MAG: RNA polymerase sigma factor [bacterium]